VESARKDVECFFGIMKARFRLLRNPICIQAFHEIDAVWFSCIILHNMLLEHDGYTTALNTEAAWEALDPNQLGGRAQLMEDRAVQADASSNSQNAQLDATFCTLPVPVQGTIVLSPQCIQAPPCFAPLPALLEYNGMLMRQATIPGEPGTTQAEVTAQHFIAESPLLPNGDNQGYDLIDVHVAELDPTYNHHRQELVTQFSGRYAQNSIHWPKALPNPVQAARNAAHAQAQAQDAAQDPAQDPAQDAAHAATAQVHFEDVAVQDSSADTFMTPMPRNARFHANALLLEIDRLAALEDLEALNSSQDTYGDV
jgi:hypothetical protein